MNTPSIIIADNQDMTAAGIRCVCMQLFPQGIIRRVSSKKELIETLCLQPDSTVILDYTLFDFSGEDNFLVICERFKTTQWLLFSSEWSNHFLRRLLFNVYAIGAITKDCSEHDMRHALRSCVELRTPYILPVVRDRLEREHASSGEKIRLPPPSNKFCAPSL